jgi:molecular chaperone GrpE
MEEKNMKDQNLQDQVDINQEGSDISSEPSVDTTEQSNSLEQELQEMKDKYLRQAAEFDNFRRRNARERIELIQTAGREVISSLLEVLDDCDRAEKQLQSSSDVKAVSEGVQLVFNKLRSTLQAKGLKPMNSIGTEFNPDMHEAITEIPAPSPDLKGKVVDELEKGYYLNDKLIRFSKVVVGK